MPNLPMNPPTEHEALYKAYEDLYDDYLSQAGSLAIVASWLRGEKGSMSDLSAQQIYDMIANEQGLPAEVITTELVRRPIDWRGDYELYQHVHMLMVKGHLITAIRDIRHKHQGVGLAEARDYCYAVQKKYEFPITVSDIQTEVQL